MSMSIEVVRLYKQGDAFSIWIDGDEAFSESDFLRTIAPLVVLKNERVFTWLGPAEFIDEIQTNSGVFNLSQEFDEFAGVTVYSDDAVLMNLIFSTMLDSLEYHERK